MSNDSLVKLHCQIKEIKELKGSKDVHIVVKYTKGKDVWHKVWRIQYPEIPVSMEWLRSEIGRLDPWPPENQDNLENIRQEQGTNFDIEVKPRSEDIAEKQAEALAEQPFPMEIQQPTATPPGTVLP